jgi:hypothetical protein
MPGGTSVAKYLNCSITLRQRMQGALSPSVQNYAAAARQPLEKPARLNPIGICVIMYSVHSPAHRS